MNRFVRPAVPPESRHGFVYVNVHAAFIRYAAIESLCAGLSAEAACAIAGYELRYAAESGRDGRTIYVDLTLPLNDQAFQVVTELHSDPEFDPFNLP